MEKLKKKSLKEFLLIFFILTSISLQTSFEDLRDIKFITKTRFPREDNFTSAITSPLDTAYIYFRNQFKFKTNSPFENGLSFIDIASHKSDLVLTALGGDNLILVSQGSDREKLEKFGGHKMTKLLNLGIDSYTDEKSQEVIEVHYAVGIDQSSSALTRFSFSDQNSYKKIDTAACEDFEGFRAQLDDLKMSVAVLFYLKDKGGFVVKGFKFDADFTEITLKVDEEISKRLEELDKVGVKSLRVTFDQVKKKFSFIAVEKTMEKIQLFEGGFTFDLEKNTGTLSYTSSESFKVKSKFQKSENFSCDHTKKYLICGVSSSKNSDEKYSSFIFFVKEGERTIHQNEYSIIDKEYPALNPATSFLVEDYNDDIITYIEPSKRIFKTLQLESSLVIWALILAACIILFTFLACMVKLCQETSKKWQKRLEEGRASKGSDYHGVEKYHPNSGSFHEVLGGLTTEIDKNKAGERKSEEEHKELTAARNSDEVKDVEIY